MDGIVRRPRSRGGTQMGADALATTLLPLHPALGHTKGTIADSGSLD